MATYYDEKQKTWYCKFYYQDFTGARKQKMKRGFKLQRDAKEWERTFLDKMQGTPDMTFQALYDLYIEDMSHRLRPSSIIGKETVFKNRILPYFKDKQIIQITATDIRAWQNETIEKSYSDAYLERIHNSMVTIFNYAVAYYNLPKNPCTRAGKMGKRSKSINFWTHEQFNSVVAYADDISAHVALMVLFYSGMRFGEFLALTPSDINFENKSISIDKTYHSDIKDGLVAAPKTANGVRVVTMPDAVMTELKEYCDKIYGLKDNERIFTFTRSLVRYQMKRCVELANVPFIRIHDLRHSNVSLLIELGFTPQLIAERIGDTVELVISTYGHLYPNKQQEVADKLNELLVSK